jgi:hypothetical protein
MSLAAISTITWIGIGCVAASLVVLLFIALSPWPREDDRRLDRDVETRLLLHEDPEHLGDELDARADARPPVAELRPDDRR